MLEKHSTSRCLTRMVKGIHRFTLEKYSLYKGVGQALSINSDFFSCGRPSMGCYQHKYEEGHVYVGLYISLMSGSDVVRCLFKMTLLDQSGKENHLTISLFDRRAGFRCFIDRYLLQKSSYLKDDCLKIECTVGIVLPSETKIMTPSIAVAQCDDVGVDFLAMLETGEGSDVVFNVRGEKFRAHKVMLSARSSVFEFMFAIHLVSGQQEMVITSVEPRVFKALLHFIYSDTLPEDERTLVAGYAFGPSVSSTIGAQLLAAADEYDLKRLKSICESHLWRSISLRSFAETPLLAERYKASVLKHLCLKYAADNYAALVELDIFTYLRQNCSLLLNEVDEYISKKIHPKKEVPVSEQLMTVNVKTCNV
ncbi:hypothetical protein Pfo_010964 [Paulownia fortunei]|nr:hypothetical protein Pfo_010964 [Paulownia fortunei]